MSKKDKYIKIARRAGIKSPDVSYNRISKTYVISIGNVKLPNAKGYTSLPVGDYSSFSEAEEHLPEDIQASVNNHDDTYPYIHRFIES